MRLEVQVQDTATPFMRALRSRLGGRAAHRAMAEGVYALIFDHLVAKNAEPNLMGAAKTNFYAQAAEATRAEADDSSAAVVIAKDGFAQRLFGGRITPKNAGALTVPVIPAARGKRAGEIGGLVRVLFTEPRGKFRNIVGLLFAPQAGSALGLVHYLLAAWVDQKADPSVLPTDEQLTAAARAGLTELAAAL